MNKEELAKKISKLPADYSLILSQILIEELSYPEVAEIIGCSEVKARQLFDEAILLLSD